MNLWEEKAGLKDSAMKKDKIWQGRIQSDPDSLAEKFTASISTDINLYMQDLTGTAAYVIGLESIGIITEDEKKKILSGLKKIRENIEKGKIYPGKYEDVHSLVEYELFALAQDAAGKVHTGRSRNDQIVTDELIFIKESVAEALSLLMSLQDTILKKAGSCNGLVMPAYTHMQKAQPVLVSHYLLSYYEKFSRNCKKLLQVFEESDWLPLGAAACAGSGYGLNTNLLAELLKFKRTGKNSMDIVSSRDYLIDYIYCCAMIMLNLGRFCEDLIIYSSQEFSYADISEQFCTGSSIMPQKKNPDILELIRGKSAVVAGSLTQIITLIKGLPSTYNSDMQEDKKILFNAKKETLDSIEIFIRVLEHTEFKALSIEDKMPEGFMEATDAADYLVKKGQSFRNAHHIIGKIVRYCIKNNMKLSDIPGKKLKEYSPYFDSDFYVSISLKSCINSKITSCGTSEKSVINNISENTKELDKLKKTLNNLYSRIPDFDELTGN